MAFILLTLLTGWICIIHSKSLFARWVYVCIIAAVIWLGSEILFSDDENHYIGH